MRTHKIGFIVLTVSLVTLIGVGLCAGAVQAQAPSQQPAANTTIPYPGHLAAEDGQAVADGGYAFTFALYTTAEGGEPLWTEVQEEVQVKDGRFTALLGSLNPIPLATLNNGNLWLQVAVRGPAESTLTALSPRQQLRAVSPQGSAPQQGSPCPHNHLGEIWYAAVGWPEPSFKVQNSASGPSI